MSELHADLQRFYALLARLKDFPGQRLRLDAADASHFSARGVYFFCEPGEIRSLSPDSPRIVRVGTHAVSIGSKSTLWGRLRTHLGTRAGGGNHRGSIFRLHVGAALLARDGALLPTWGVGSSAPPAVRNDASIRAAEALLERKVSSFIGAMTVLWIDVPDEPSPNSVRASIERNAIALLSNRFKPVEPASAGWLGRSSPRNEIRRSNLWNLNYVDHAYDARFLEELACAVERTGIRADA